MNEMIKRIIKGLPVTSHIALNSKTKSNVDERTLELKSASRRRRRKKEVEKLEEMRM